MSPVRGSGWYKRPWRLTWFDKETGKKGHAEFHWAGPARTRLEELRSLPSRFFDVEVRLVNE